MPKKESKVLMRKSSRSGKTVSAQEVAKNADTTYTMSVSRRRPIRVETFARNLAEELRDWGGNDLLEAMDKALTQGGGDYKGKEILQVAIREKISKAGD